MSKTLNSSTQPMTKNNDDITQRRLYNPVVKKVNANVEYANELQNIKNIKSDVISETEYEILANTIISGLTQYLPQGKECCTCHKCKKRRNVNKIESIKTREKGCIFQSRQDDSFISLPYIENYTECNDYIGDNSTVAITLFLCPQSDKMTFVNKKNKQIVVNVILNFDIINTKIQTICTLYTETSNNGNKTIHDEQDFIIPISSVYNLLYMGTNIIVPENGTLSIKYELSTTIKLHSYNLFIVEV